MDNPIGVFDSGVGGLSVLSEIHNFLPHEATIYVADQAFMPYGQKSQKELQDRVAKILDFFKEKKAKIAVMACNTATIYTIDEMRKRFKFPIIGTVPVVKVISEKTKSNVIAVFSTPASSKSKYMNDLIDKFAQGKTVLKVGESHLEDLIEEGKTETKEVKVILNELLNPLLELKVDAIALGCTHYSFIKKEIEAVVGKHVLVADSAGAVARRLHQVLEHERLSSLQKGQDLYYTTGDSALFESVSKKLIKKTLKAKHITL